MNYAELLPDDAPTSLYLEEFGRLFAAHSTPPLEVLVINEDMSQRRAQHATLQLAQRLEHNEFTGKAQLWLLDYLLFRDRLTDRSRDFYEVARIFRLIMRCRHRKITPYFCRVFPNSSNKSPINSTKCISASIR